MLPINNMPKGKQPRNSHWIQTKLSSPEAILSSEASFGYISDSLPPQGTWKCNLKQCTFLATLVLCSLMFGYEVNALRISPDVIINEPINFQFMVFCPASDADFLPLQNSSIKGDVRRLQAGSGYILDFQKNEQYLPNNTYIVRIQGHQTSNTVTLYYCGRMRYFNDTCDHSFDSCSASPMFDLEEKGSIDIIWINNLDNTTNVTNTGTCMDANFSEPFAKYCTLEGKANMTQTYDDPTDMPPEEESDLRIAFDGWPISTHVHGGEVRPTFDGNPISWISNDPNRKSFGVAAFSLNEACYYSSFESNVGNKSLSIPPNYKIYDINGKLKSNFKVNRYPNKQNPGTLWYHDHAMHLTNFNVKLGLAGFYILRDSNVTQYLGVARQNEKFVLITNNESKYQLSGFSAETVYRFRFLNANYASGMTFRYSFSYNNCNHSNPDLQNFTLIGADSSLFAYGIENQTHFVLSNAERIDLLIKFAPGKGSFSICGDANISVPPDQVKRLNIDTTKPIAGPHSKFNIKNITLFQYASYKDRNSNTSTVNKIDLSRWVSYTNLSNVPQEQVRVSRFRPLVIVNSSLTIHGRVEFHSGQSQNPTMGTIQDWFIINTMSFAHPIHIHLINFQVVKVYTLRLFKTARSTCPFYQLDFLAAAVENSTANDLQSEVFQDGAVNYTYLCNNIRQIVTDSRVIHSLSQIYPENQIQNKTSGLDLFTLNEDGSYKYILGPGRPSSNVVYQQWKDTAFVDRYQVLQFRTRWSKSNYTASVDDPIGSYFHAPADTMREYPGYVYHCHILDHEDNQMMRPIMLQLPEDGPALTGPCPQFEWSDKVPCINQRCANASLKN